MHEQWQVSEINTSFHNNNWTLLRYIFYCLLKQEITSFGLNDVHFTHEQWQVSEIDTRFMNKVSYVLMLYITKYTVQLFDQYHTLIFTYIDRV